MSELELTCPDCSYSRRGPEEPYPDTACPECNGQMDRKTYLNEAEAKRFREIMKMPPTILPASLSMDVRVVDVDDLPREE